MFVRPRARSESRFCEVVGDSVGALGVGGIGCRPSRESWL